MGEDVWDGGDLGSGVEDYSIIRFKSSESVCSGRLAS